MRMTKYVALCSLIATGALGNGVSAQDTDVAFELEEIIVTATKRSERLQDVPISVSVLGGTEIDARGLEDMDDYLSSLPGVSFQKVSATENAIVIRGIETSPQAQNFGAGTTVATYFGETPITSSAGITAGSGIDMHLVDIERIEVLKGPQGTSFGNSSLGGAVRTLPKAPNVEEFEGAIGGYISSTERGGGFNNSVHGIANIPVIKDKLALRAVAYRVDESGHYSNNAEDDADLLATAAALSIPSSYLVNLDDRGAVEKTGVRLSALLKISDQVSLTTSYVHQKTEQTGFAYTTTGDDLTYAQFLVRPEYSVRGENDGVTDSKIDIFNATLDVDLGWSTLVASASTIDSQSIRTHGGFAGRYYGFNQTAEHDGFAGEVRMVSNFQGPFQFLAGVYYEDLDDVAYEDYYLIPELENRPFPDMDNILLGVFDTFRSLEQKAVFGELSYDITDQLSVTVGGRAYNYEKTNRTESSGWFTGAPLDDPNIAPSSVDQSGQTFKANVSYKPNENMHFYGSWSEGFRLGRPAVGLLQAVCDVDADGLLDSNPGVTMESTRSIADDNVETYELGAKLRWWDGRGTLDASVFKTNWEGLPTNARADCGGENYFFVVNAGKASAKGIETQTSVRLSESLRIDAGFSVIDAELTTDVNTLNAFAGDRLPGSPKFNGNLSLQYDFSVGDMPAFIRGDSMYRGSYFGDLSEDPLTKAGGYFLADMKLGVEIENARVELFVDNITNVNKFMWRGTRNSRDGFGYVMRPRTIGLRATYNF